MKLNFLTSKIFYGTDSHEEVAQIFNFLLQSGIRCTYKTYYNFNSFRFYSGDSFHIYSKDFLQSVTEFHIIRVHRLDYKKALKIYF